MVSRAENNVYMWMVKRANQFLTAMRSPTKRVGLTGVKNRLIVVDGGKTKPTGMKLHVDDEGDTQEGPFESEPK